MRNCIKAYRASILIEEILNGLSANKSQYDMDVHFNELEEMNAIGIIPCMECAACCDFLFYIQTLDEVRCNTISNDTLKRKLHTWKKTQLSDEALTHINHNPKQSDFNKSKVSINGFKVYLDQNLLSEYAKNSTLRNRINNLKTLKKITFYYSPSHLEETFKIPNYETKKLLISSIRQLTDDVVILPEQNVNTFFVENPEFGLKRVAKCDGSTQALEELMLLSSKDRKMYIPKYDTNEHRSKIANNKSIFNSISDNEFRELISLSHSSLLYKDDYQGITDKHTLLHAIYTLSSALNLIGYKLDKKEKTIKSALHDIEHLVYASEADLFVTNDVGFRERANQIYKFMHIGTKVISLDELESFVKLT